MEQFETIIKAELELVTDQLHKIATYNTKTGDWVATPETVTKKADTNVSADTTEDWNERRALMSQLETRFHNLQIALKKFAISSFGTCEICSEDIEIDRLTANPAARTCKLHLERERELPF